MNAPPQDRGPATRALWVIAFALVLIAACLVVMVCRQMFPQRQVAQQAAVAPTQEQPKTSAESKPVSPFLRKPELRPARVQAAIEEPSASRQGPTAEGTIESPVAAPAKQPEWQVSSGFAPLNEAASSNITLTGLIRGRVTLFGTPPPEAPLPLDALCGKLHTTPKTTHNFQVSKNGGLAGVFVFIKSGLGDVSFPAPPTPLVVKLAGCEFQPDLLGAVVGQRLIVTNADPVKHNIQFVSNLGTNEPNGTLLPGAATSIFLTSPQSPLFVLDNLHPWMRATVFVLDHPFFSVTDANGNYTITNVPSGDYVLEASHGKMADEIKSITVKSGQTTPANFKFQAPPPKTVASTSGTK